MSFLRPAGLSSNIRPPVSAKGAAPAARSGLYLLRQAAAAGAAGGQLLDDRLDPGVDVRRRLSRTCSRVCRRLVCSCCIPQAGISLACEISGVA